MVQASLLSGGWDDLGAWADRVDFNLTGLSRGGQQVQKARDTYIKAVGTLVELASLQVSLLRWSGIDVS